MPVTSTPFARAARRHVVAALAGAALLVTGCAGTDDEPAAAPTVSATTAAPTTAPDQTASPAPTVTPDDAQVVSITVAGGEVTGDTGRVEVPLGTMVRLTITSDASDEVHVHGFELTEQVAAGQPTQLEFLADQAGIFAVEFHDSRQVLTRLQVQ